MLQSILFRLFEHRKFLIFWLKSFRRMSKHQGRSFELKSQNRTYTLIIHRSSESAGKTLDWIHGAIPSRALAIIPHAKCPPRSLADKISLCATWTILVLASVFNINSDTFFFDWINSGFNLFGCVFAGAMSATEAHYSRSSENSVWLAMN
jgi:hypothetical protein